MIKQKPNYPIIVSLLSGSQWGRIVVNNWRMRKQSCMTDGRKKVETTDNCDMGTWLHEIEYEYLWLWDWKVRWERYGAKSKTMTSYAYAFLVKNWKMMEIYRLSKKNVPFVRLWVFDLGSCLAKFWVKGPCFIENFLEFFLTLSVSKNQKSFEKSKY